MWTIAEISINHRNSLKHTKELISIAQDTGFDYVKFQAYDLEDFIEDRKERAGFDKDFFEQHKMSPGLLKGAVEHCEDIDMPWGVTPTKSRVQECVDLNPGFLKVGSDQVRDEELVCDLAKFSEALDIPLFLSTGMSSLEETEDIINNPCLQFTDKVIFHCTSQYPTDINNAHLGRLIELIKNYMVTSGYSDHTQSGYGSYVAAFTGVDYIERHVCLSHTDVDAIMGFASVGYRGMKGYMDLISGAKKIIGDLTLEMGDSEKLERDKWLRE